MIEGRALGESLPEAMTRLVREAVMEIELRNTPRGLFWPEEHARICKAAERVTRQQRRHQERQARKAR